MLRRDEIGDRQKQKGQDEEEKHEDDSVVGPQGGNQEHETQETPCDQVDPEGKSECPLVSLVCVLDAERRDQEHGKAEPKGAIRAVHSRPKCVSHSELHDACDKLRCATHEDGQSEDGLVGTDFPFRIRMRQSSFRSSVDGK